ncbi:hypothetical protein Achl_4413 (plasmid) [Pseudarthrobacter chlorophenolicus A6]|uniref:Uncharacterized protein n=1 Tax=Pseudarthrobacter chlorophenolicus (strain ATCC 700700 / DSM 12829 / CIP 107037 / JCM 12360 / KCTC 9906 / NCIMB 13794 / A6) TaxID=452863 RepID=B8HIW7_PSECP|nr:hypothetical protein [Pseudarthrobacter chlorophenolicus]ACL42364.1 hypothetical protein Achl_4413 [Pseudarthrobacter chlorophenolicus A6]SDQ17102.1 hypothetical protein SAMN04489738_0470 [Pseudarthrobacter chlorophenolicus]
MTSTITIDQLRNREIGAAELLATAGENDDRSRNIVTAPGAPLSVFGRKLAGHGG